MIDGLWISTAPRSTEIQYQTFGYFETIVWEFDVDKKKLGKILYMGEADTARQARKLHERIVKIFRYKKYRARRCLCLNIKTLKK